MDERGKGLVWQYTVSYQREMRQPEEYFLATWNFRIQVLGCGR